MDQLPLRRVRIWVGIFIAGLVLSGLTAFPLQSELRWLLALTDRAGRQGPLAAIVTRTHLLPWLQRVLDALTQMNARYPFLSYGTDWLAFAHLVIAVAFIGLWTDPVRNRWLITFGLIACGGVIPLALIAGQVRGIPWGWRLVDCSFGVVGCLPLVVVRTIVREMEKGD